MRTHVPIPKPSANGHSTRNGRARKEPFAPVSDGEPDAEPTPKPPTETPNSERTATGQFAKGNKCSLGNPFARRLGALRSAFLNAVTDADVAAVARKLADLAATGDVQAAALFLAYAVGKPLSAVDPDRLDLDEFALVDAAPTRTRLMAVTLDALDPAAATAIAQMLVVTDPDKALAAYGDALKNMGTLDAKAVLAEKNARIGKPAKSHPGRS